MADVLLPAAAASLWPGSHVQPSSCSDSYHSCQASLHISPSTLTCPPGDTSICVCACVRKRCIFVPLSQPQTDKKWLKRSSLSLSQSRGVILRSCSSRGFSPLSEDYVTRSDTWQARDRKGAVYVGVCVCVNRCSQRYWPDKPQHLELPEICKDKRRKITGSSPRSVFSHAKESATLYLTSARSLARLFIKIPD